MDKLFKLDQWNLYTKDVKYTTTREKWFEITNQVRLEIRAVLRKTIMIKMRGFQLKLYILVLLKIDVVDKLLRLDQWNFYTKNVKHNTSKEKWFEITD